MRRGTACLFLLTALAAAASSIHAAKPDKRPKPDYLSLIVAAYRPEYPYEARRDHITGTGRVVMHIDRTTGKVSSCEMELSTGSRMLDEAAVDAFRRWRFKPGTIAGARIPITFSMSGQVLHDYHIKEKPMDEALSRFLGKGTVINGPIPDYPRSIPWTTKQGRGRYEVHVGKDGRVSEVRILKPSGDEVFDRTTVDTLRTWRLRRGPLILELPLSFNLTPTHYSVAIPKGR